MYAFDERRLYDNNDIAFEGHPRYATEQFWMWAVSALRDPEEQHFVNSLDEAHRARFLLHRAIRHMAYQREVYYDTSLDRMFPTQDAYSKGGRRIPSFEECRFTHNAHKDGHCRLPPFDERRFTDCNDLAYERRETYNNYHFWSFLRDLRESYCSDAQHDYANSLDFEHQLEFYKRCGIALLVDQNKYNGNGLLDGLIMQGGDESDGDYMAESPGPPRQRTPDNPCVVPFH